MAVEIHLDLSAVWDTGADAPAGGGHHLNKLAFDTPAHVIHLNEQPAGDTTANFKSGCGLRSGFNLNQAVDGIHWDSLDAIIVGKILQRYSYSLLQAPLVKE